MAIDEQRELTPSATLAHQILLVEDEPETASFLKDLLERQGYAVTVAKDGGQAHSIFSMHKPDFVILDLMLPGESGFEICERFKQMEESVPILVLSVIDMDDSRSLAARAGADGYLVKPFDPNELLSSINEIAEAVWRRTHLEQPEEPARIRFSCRCGKRFKVSSIHRGKSLTCPRCGETVIVPRHG